ncbi:MAG: class I SAM-dependent methyltransferase, partial [Candidatus Nanopelagicales bacterium]
MADDSPLAASGVIPPDVYRENLAAWDERAPAHARADGYAVDRFIDDSAYLSDVVRFDVPLLGDLTDVRAVHLQCHIGTDTLSLARLGANMVGLDFSAESLAQARALSEAAGPEVEYVRTDVYSAPEALGRERFDLVFTGIGAVCWLPDIRRW